MLRVAFLCSRSPADWKASPIGSGQMPADDPASTAYRSAVQRSVAPFSSIEGYMKRVAEVSIASTAPKKSKKS